MNEIRFLSGVAGIMLWAYGIVRIDPPLSYAFAMCGGMLIGFFIWGLDGKKGGR